MILILHRMTFSSFGMTAASVYDFHHIKDIHWKYHDCTMFGDKDYLSVDVRKNLFETVNITFEVLCRLNQRSWHLPSRVYRRLRKRNEFIFC